MVKDNSPPTPSGDLRKWAADLHDWLSSNKNQGRVEPTTVLLAHRKTTRDERASVGGLVMFDQLFGAPMYSRGGTWYRVSSTAYRAITTTPYTITEDMLSVGHNIFGINAGEDTVVNLPDNVQDPSKLVVIKNEMADFTVTIIP